MVLVSGTEGYQGICIHLSFKPLAVAVYASLSQGRHINTGALSPSPSPSLTTVLVTGLTPPAAASRPSKAKAPLMSPASMGLPPLVAAVWRSVQSPNSGAIAGTVVASGPGRSNPSVGARQPVG